MEYGSGLGWAFSGYLAERPISQLLKKIKSPSGEFLLFLYSSNPLKFARCDEAYTIDNCRVEVWKSGNKIKTITGSGVDRWVADNEFGAVIKFADGFTSGARYYVFKAPDWKRKTQAVLHTALPEKNEDIYQTLCHQNGRCLGLDILPQEKKVTVSTFLEGKEGTHHAVTTFPYPRGARAHEAASIKLDPQAFNFHVGKQAYSVQWETRKVQTVAAQNAR